MILLPIKVDVSQVASVQLKTLAVKGRAFIGPDRNTEYLIADQGQFKPAAGNVQCFNLTTNQLEEILDSTAVYPV